MKAKNIGKLTSFHIFATSQELYLKRNKITMRNQLMDFIAKKEALKMPKALTANPTLRLFAMATVAVFFAGCPSDTGDLIGVQGRSPWLHPQPPGMVYVRTGTFHTGQGTQDVFQSYLEPNKQMTVTGFWMDETEITNNEYRQFVHHVIDSLARAILDEETGGGVHLELAKKPVPPEAGVALFTSRVDDPDDLEYDPNAFDNEGNPIKYINYDEPLDKKYRSKNGDNFDEILYRRMDYQGAERFRFKRQIDTRKLKYHYQWQDLALAANIDRDKYNAMNRERFLVDEDVLVYPDTLCWIRDFTYSYNEPMARQYFWHPRYDDYPVVGVNWAQARAFCHWRTHLKESYWNRIGLPNTEDFRLPTEYEWEYAARGGRIGNRFPWGGPYARNSKGCMLANFKPMRGDYGASDGGVYPVRVDSYFPNDFGLYNMSGNVSEWTSTAWDETNNSFVHDLNGNYDIYIKEHSEDAKEQQEIMNIPISRKRKVIRGGSWKDVAYYIECGARTFEYQDTSKSYVGFRCVQSYIGRSNQDSK